MREIRMLRTTWWKLETELWDGGTGRWRMPPANGYFPSSWPPRQLSTLPESGGWRRATARSEAPPLPKPPETATPICLPLLRQLPL